MKRRTDRAQQFLKSRAQLRAYEAARSATAPRKQLQAKKNDDELELMLYGEIGDDWFGMGISPSDVAEELRAAGEVARIVVRINSPGGDVFDGATIYNLLASQGVPVDVVIDGLAASAASYIAMVGEKVTMGEGAMMMIHNPWALAIGDAADMRKMADTLDKIRDSMLSAYMKRFEGTEEELKAALDAETWMTADDAKEAGLCDEITNSGADEDAKDLVAAFDLSVFKNVPKKLKKQIPRSARNDNKECECSCGPCQDTGDCQECSHENCDCAGCDCPDHKAKSQGTGKPRNRACSCSCGECQDVGDCRQCSHENCDCEGCNDCPEKSKAQSRDYHRRKLALHERQAQLYAKGERE